MTASAGTSIARQGSQWARARGLDCANGLCLGFPYRFTANAASCHAPGAGWLGTAPAQVWPPSAAVWNGSVEKEMAMQQNAPAPFDGSDHLIQVENLTKWFPLGQGFLRELLGRQERAYLKAVDGVSFTIKRGEALGLAGESGCGKSTTGMTLLKLYEPTGGAIRFMNEDLAAIQKQGTLRKFRRHAQIVFQNPFESLNPRLTVYQSVREPIAVHFPGDESAHVARAVVALERAGLTPAETYLNRYPHELSGGQLQRVAIARAIGVEPSFLVADEPVSMLDVSIRAGILKLLRHFTGELSMGMLYISHDLSTMKQVCARVGVMYLGKIVEIGPTDAILHSPKHPYAQALVAAIPAMANDAPRKRIHLQGAVPNPINMPAGCRFHPRCPAVMPRCQGEEPALHAMPDGRQVACHLFD